MRVESINGKKYALVFVDDYSRYTWTHFLRSKDETPEVLIDFLILVQRGLHAQVRIVQTHKGTKFLNNSLHAYFASERIHHQTSIARTLKQNSVVERRNRTLVVAARTMLSAAKVPLSKVRMKRIIQEFRTFVSLNYSYLIMKSSLDKSEEINKNFSSDEKDDDAITMLGTMSLWPLSKWDREKLCLEE
nr:putative ribonuclease H-like domain-containing protein [Tanacetum cinerariifolium]